VTSKNKIFCSWIILLIGLSSFSCGSVLYSKLQGEWRCLDVVQCEAPDFILFHESGRYIIFNDLESPHPWMSIVEKGDWVVTHNRIKLINREFVVRGASFQKYHGNNTELLIQIRQISENELVLEFGRDTKKYGERYQKVNIPAKMMQRYTTSDGNPAVLTLPSIGSATILKLSYEFDFYTPNSEGVELIVEDQNNNELWRKVITENAKGIEEILLADKPGVENFTQLIFNVKYINYATRPSWELKAKIY